MCVRALSGEEKREQATLAASIFLNNKYNHKTEALTIIPLYSIHLNIFKIVCMNLKNLKREKKLYNSFAV